MSTQLKILVTVLILTLSAGRAQAISCRVAMGNLLRALPFQYAQGFDSAAYEKAKNEWSLTLGDRVQIAKEQTVLKKLNADPSLENQVALFDAVSKAPRGLGQAISELESDKKITVLNKPYALPIARAPTYRMKWNGILRGQFLNKSPRQIKIKLSPKVNNLEQAFGNLIALSEAVKEAETGKLRNSAPIFKAYRKPLLDQVESAADRVYHLVDGVEKAFPTVKLQMAEDGPKKMGYLKATLATPLVALFPMFDPLKKAYPSREGYGIWKNGREKNQPSLFRDYLNSRFSGRTNLKYIESLAFKGFVTFAMSSALIGTVKLGLFLASPEREIQQNQATALVEIGTNGKKAAQAVNDYKTREGGDPGVVEYYTNIINELKARIANEGDPNGALQKQIKEQEELRDLMKN